MKRYRRRSYRWLSKLLDFLTQFAVIAAALSIAAGALAPWGQATLFRHVDLQLPGAIYRDGMIVLAISTLVLLVRRYRVLALAAAYCVFLLWVDAVLTVPREIKSHILGVQISLFPVNSLLDQAHLPNITIGNFSLPDAQYLMYGLNWVRRGVTALTVAAVAGLPFDPVILWLWRRLAKAKCKACGVSRLASRDVDYCPSCGAWQLSVLEPIRCAACRTLLGARDRYCVSCGLENRGIA